MHKGHSLKNIRFITLAQDRLENLINGNCGDDKIRRFLKWMGKERRIGTVREILKPSGRVDHVHSRSGSLSTVVSIPLRNPFISEIVFRGIISILLP